MLHKCEQYTHKDKDIGGTMRERINRLARGIIDSGIPELVLARPPWLYGPKGPSEAPKAPPPVWRL